MPMELLGGDGIELRKSLLAMGAQIAPSRFARELLTEYLQSEVPKRKMRSALQVGWSGKSFVLPDTVIGTEAAEVIFQTGERGHEEFNTRGTLQQWQSEVADLAVGNWPLMLSISSAFAAALINQCNGESGGFHCEGDSSIGKIGLLDAARSVWGGPACKRTWRSTSNGMESTAAL
jgi:putative DNA primase/helicase